MKYTQEETVAKEKEATVKAGVETNDRPRRMRLQGKGKTDEAAENGAFDFLTMQHNPTQDVAVRDGMQAWEIWANKSPWSTITENTEVTITQGGIPEGLEFSKSNCIGLISHTTKDIARMGIGSGHVLKTIGGIELCNITEIGGSNRYMRAHLGKLTRNTILTFAPPVHKNKRVPFQNGEWLRLFTDGGQSNPNSENGLATCGYVIRAGPFLEHNLARITDLDGTLIYQGRAFLGKGNTYTNNDGEFAGLFVGPKKCWELDTNKVHHMADSRLVTNVESGKSTAERFNTLGYHRKLKTLKKSSVKQGGGVLSTNTCTEKGIHKQMLKDT